MVELLDNKIQKIYIEKAGSALDKFDDIKVFNNKEIHHYQVKYSPKNRLWSLTDFLDPNDNLYIEKTFRFWRQECKKYNISLKEKTSPCNTTESEQVKPLV